MGMTFPSHNQSAEVAQPGDCALHNPTMAITRKVGFTPSLGAFTSSFRDARPNTPTTEPLLEPSAVIAFVRHQGPGSFLGAPTPPGYPNAIQGRLCQLHLGFLSAGYQGRQGCSSSIGHHHHPGAFPTAGEAYRLAPFLAGTKVPSRKARLQSILPRKDCSFRVERKVVHMRSHTPCACHSCRRLWQVESLPYSLGRSCQHAPERSTQRIPLRVRRSSARLRPRPLGGGSRGATSFHWASVKFPAMAEPPSAVSAIACCKLANLLYL